VDSVAAPIQVLPEVVDAVGGRAEVFVDGGYRRGVDVVITLALGARAGLISRPYLYGLAVGGEAGVWRVSEILPHEIARTIALVGCTQLPEIDRTFVGSDPMSDWFPDRINR
jgi:isopentenyl diphosphate isomerase/L-lactate dehydrogenase-like FMN-dependent dehydrogenase